MTTELARRNDLLPDTTTWKTMLEMADVLVKSGMLPSSIKTPQAALAIIQKGQELHIPPMQALSNISVINGKPVTGAELMLAMIYRDHGDNALQFEETTAERCVVAYKRRGWAQARRFEWTIDDAKRAGLLNKGGTWSQYPPTMLRHRCVSAVARLAFPDTIGGMHTPEEMGAEVAVTEDGAVEIVERSAPVVTIVPKIEDVAPPVSHAADKETRARFEANWEKGVARAAACGVTPDDKPGPEATKGKLNIAQRELLEAITAREALNTTLIEKQRQATILGYDGNQIDPTQADDVALHEALAAFDSILSNAPDTDGSEDAPF